MLTVMVWLGVGIGIVGFWRDWRGKDPGKHFRMPAAWPYSAASWDGVRGAAPIAFIGVLCLALAWTFASLEMIFGVAFFVLIPVFAAAAIWGLPNRLRPPALRDRPTVASTWRERS
jgi:hypothetical protein